MLITACVCFIVFTIPAFILMSTANFVTVLVVELIMCLILTINDGTLSSYLSETFPTQVRYSGFALSFNMANALFGGTASFICTSLITATGSTLAPAFYMVDCGPLLPRLPGHGRQVVEEFLFGDRILPTRLLETILHRATLLKGNNLPANG